MSKANRPMPTANRHLWLLVIPILLLTAWLGARGLNADAIWNDEFLSLHDAGSPPHGPITADAIWERVATRNPWHAPGYFIMLGGWGALTGWSPVTMRALAWLFGLLGVAWTYRLGRDLVSAEVGIYAAGIIGTSAFVVNYLHEIRMYTLFIVFTAFTVWVYLRIMHRRPGILDWLGLLFGVVGMLYTHYFSTIPLAALGVYHLWLALRGSIRTQGRRWFGIAGVMLLAALLYLPWLNVLRQGLQLAADSTELHERALSLTQSLDRLVYLFGNGQYWLFGLVLLLALVGWVVRRMSPPPGQAAEGINPVWRIWFFALATVAALLLVNVVLKVMHIGRVRYVLASWVLIALVFGWGIESVGRLIVRPVAWGLFAVWMAFGIAASLSPSFISDVDGSYLVFPMHRIADRVKPYAYEDDILVSYPPDDFPFWVYDTNALITTLYFNDAPLNHVTARTMNETDLQPEKQAEVEAAIGDRQRLWLAYMPAFKPRTFPDLQAILDADYQQCRVLIDDPDLHISEWTRAPLCCAASNPDPAPIVTFGDGIAMTGLEPLPGSVNRSLRVITRWSVSESVPADTYSVGLHISDAAGRFVTQSDYGLPHMAFVCKQVEIDVSDLDPGIYTLNVVVYRWFDGVRLTGQHVESGAEGDLLPLATFTVR